MRPDPLRIKELTGLRFIAAAGVMVHHASVFNIDFPRLAYGQGVSMFFVLSGFILAHVYPELRTWHETKRFLSLRIARIWPAHVAALILVLFVAGMTIDSKFVPNLLMLHGWVPIGAWYFSYNAVSWTISTELFFYLAFPFLIWGWASTFWWKRLAALGLLVCLCLLASRLDLPLAYSPEPIVTAHGLLYISPLSRLLEFVTGMVAYSLFVWVKPATDRVVVRTKPKLVFAAGTALELATIGLVLYSLKFSPLVTQLHSVLGAGAWLEWAGHAGNFPFFVLLILVFSFGFGAVSRLLSFALSQFLGEISYSVYLLHQIVYRQYTMIWPVKAADYLGFAVCILLTILLAALIWRWIEVPCRAWVKRAFVTAPAHSHQAA